MVKSLVSKLSSASNISLASTLSSVGVGHGSSTQETNYAKHRNDPGRFFGDGVQFKAKLIGILEVGEARGDRMCQEALQDLKMAIRAAGEHKQRITIHVTIDGLRLRDEKTGDSLYHHPVHKISFIAQDMTDSRAFGYIFGSPDSGHRFFGIKTDKAASQVVLAMRDLFQVVFELKKKEIELARQHIQSKSIHEHHLASLSSLKSAGGGAHNDLSGNSSGVGGAGALNTLSGIGGSSGSNSMARLGVNNGKGAAKEMSPESVADLVDLEQELSSIQRGITQMERITPNDPTQPNMGTGGKDEDPFGDSFTNFRTYNLLPPPESGRSRNKPSNKATESVANSTVTTASSAATTSQNAQITTLLSPAPAAGGSGSPSVLQQEEDDSWLNELDQQNDVFDTTKMSGGAISLGNNLPLAPLAASESTSTPTQQLSENSAVEEVCGSGSGMGTSLPLDMEQSPATTRTVKSDAFTDLDPLGTGRTRPYVDKKYFFQELKNPPKKVLKDLSVSNTSISATTATSLATQLATGGSGTSVDNIVGTQYKTAANVVDEFLAKDGLFEQGTTSLVDDVEQQQQQQQHLHPPKSHQTLSTNLTTTNTNNNNNNNNNSNNIIKPAGTSLSHIGVLTPKIRPCTTTMTPTSISTVITTTTTTTTTTFISTSIHLTNISITNTNTNTNNKTATATATTTKTVASDIVVSTTSRLATTAITNKSLLTAATITGKSFNRTTPTSKTTPTNLHLNRYALDSIAADGLISTEAVMLPRDTDPFSPTRKKSDPFQEGDIFSKLDPFEFEFTAPKAAAASASAAAAAAATTTITTTTVTAGDANQRISPTTASVNARRVATEVFNGPLQVNLPPERGVSPSSAVSGVHWKSDISRLERQSSISPTIPASSSIRSRPTPSAVALGISSSSSSSATHSHATPSSMLKQQTVDVISSISNKKMPHLFGQARFSKRGDSNTINMRRLQESDSLSENEAAPEPPPRPDSALHVEPPPLPPKKQFNDIIIRPRVTSGNAVPPISTHSLSSMTTASAASSNRYEFLSSVLPTKPIETDVPPIPLPSRRVGRSDGSYPGPGRPRKPGHTDDDYLAPIGSSAAATSDAALNGSGDVPPLLPPPTQVSTRARAQRQQSLTYKGQELYENKNEILHHQQQQQQQQLQQESSEESSSIIPDITLSQLLTLGIDELALKLNVPTSKLSTMTLVELTSYLSEFIEKTKPAPLNKPVSNEFISPKPTVGEQSSVFKVNFDPQATFVAKFDDTFGEDMLPQPGRGGADDAFVANFEKFNEPPVTQAILTKAGGAPAIPSADRYAVFREIIDQELQSQKESVDLMGMTDVPTLAEQQAVIDTDDLESKVAKSNGTDLDTSFKDDNGDFLSPQSASGQPPTLKIDTKITEVVAQAKDRYAALRDIILVENLFDKKIQQPAEKDYSQEYPEFSDEFPEDQDINQIMKNRVSSADSRLLDSRGMPVEPSSSVVTIEDDDDEEDDDAGGESSLDSNEKDSGVIRARQDQYEKLSTSNQQLDIDQTSAEKQKSTDAASSNSNLSSTKQDNKFLTVAGTSGLSSSKDDLEIDELMQRAISNLSLDSRERISPATSTGITAPGPRSTSATLTSTQSPIPASAIQQRSPVSLVAPSTQMQSKSPQISPIAAPLAAVSNLIDTASKQIGSVVSSVDLMIDTEAPSKSNRKEAWATFDSPKTAYPEISGHERRGTRTLKSAKATSLHLPPAPPSNTSQNDTAESPCSSDPRDDGWGKGRRCWTKTKDRQQTSSSSRDLSPWDDDGTEYQKQQQRRMMGAAPHSQAPGSVHPAHADRHGYYMRHARRMNSCDEDYDYEEDFSSRREHRKFKQGLSRSRDNFDLDSPSWYHHANHHTWSPQDIEQAAVASRMRAFDRSAYERTTYGPPIYDKRAGGGVTSASYDRRGGGGYDKRKYRDYRDYPPRANYDFEEYGETPPMPERYRDAGSFEKSKIGRRSDYENVYDDGRSPMSLMYGGGNSRARAEYGMYERDRKSFDRESVESFESSTRRRRSFGSGDVYGSLESREEFRERYMMGSGGEKTRSLRKSMKLRATGDIDYEQDSENDFHQRTRGGTGGPTGVTMETRSLQRPSQLVPGSSTGLSRMRKSSGSSPWDGEEPPLPGQKSAWKRPGSATESERRLAEGRRVAAVGQTPSGSDGEKDRRFRKKTRGRTKDYTQSSGIIGGVPTSSGPVGCSRYGSNYECVNANVGSGVFQSSGENIDNDDNDEEDYADEEYDEPPTDEDKFERLNRRRHEMHQRMLESERRQHAISKSSKTAGSGAPYTSTGSKRYHHHGGMRVAAPISSNASKYDLEDYDEQTPTPHSNASSANPTSAGLGGGSTKFSFDGGGFESDFNQISPPPAPLGTASSCTSTPATTTRGSNANKNSFRFSNDFSEREKLQHFGQNSTSISSLQQFEMDTTTSPASHATPPNTQKLRFDERVKVSQFDDAAFEDDFSKAQFDFTKTDEQWQQPETTHTGPLATGVTTSAALATKKQNLRNSKLQQRQELIKKSESINIFAKKAEDPFEDDEFFKAPTADIKPLTTPVNTGNLSDHGMNDKRTGQLNNTGTTFQWDNNNDFAKFDENM